MEKFLTFLLHSLKHGTLMPVVGPDLGAVGVPDSHDLARKLSHYAGRDDLESAPLSRVLDEAILDLGRTTVVRFLRDEFRSGALSPGSLHRLLAMLPCKLYATTAWDGLLIQSLEEAKRDVCVVAESGDLAYCSPDSIRVLALLGTPDRPDTLRLDQDDRKALEEEHAPMVKTLQQAAVSGVALLLGYDAGDPTLEWLAGLLAPTLERVGGKAFACLPDADERERRWLERERVEIVPVPAADLLERMVSEVSVSPPPVPSVEAGTSAAEKALKALHRQRLLEEIAALEKQLAQLQRDLNTVELQIAKYGLDVPLHLINTRDELRSRLEEVQHRLEKKESDAAQMDYKDGSLEKRLSSHKAR